MRLPEEDIRFFKENGREFDIKTCRVKITSEKMEEILMILNSKQDYTRQGWTIGSFNGKNIPSCFSGMVAIVVVDSTRFIVDTANPALCC